MQIIYIYIPRTYVIKRSIGLNIIEISILFPFGVPNVTTKEHRF
jgi:hypothetical protein